MVDEKAILKKVNDHLKKSNNINKLNSSSKLTNKLDAVTRSVKTPEVESPAVKKYSNDDINAAAASGKSITEKAQQQSPASDIGFFDFVKKIKSEYDNSVGKAKEKAEKLRNPNKLDLNFYKGITDEK